MKIKELIFILGFSFCLFTCNRPPLENIRFIALNSELEWIIDTYNTESEELLERLKKTILKWSSTPEHIAKIQHITDLREKAIELDTLFSQLKRKLIDKAGDGIYLGSRTPRNLQGNAQVRAICLGEDGNVLIEKVISFNTYLQKKVLILGFKKSDFNDLSIKKSFLAENFSNSSLAEMLATLSELQIRIKDIHKTILKKVNENLKHQISNAYTTNLMPMVSAESNWLKVGETYEAEVFLVNALKTSIPLKMTANRTPIKVNEKGVGEVRFIAQGKGWQTWQGSVTFLNRGRDTTLFMTKKYYVIPREIQ